MPTLLSAKQISEHALRKIGRFPTTQDQADAGDLHIAMGMLEFVLQDFFGQSSVASAWGTLQIPLLSSLAEYELKQFSSGFAAAGVQFVYAAELVEVASDQKSPLDILNEEKFFQRTFSDTGLPNAIYVNKGPDTAGEKMLINPMLGPDVADGSYKVYLQIQTFATKISENTGAPLLNIRPTYYLWAISKLAYQLGTGTLRRLPKTETDQFKVDYEEMETKLTGFDGSENDNQPFTPPWGQ